MKRFATFLSAFLYFCMFIGMVIGIAWAGIPN